MMQAARDVGGDFYDVIPLSSDRVGVLVADVAGKGFPASLYMALARTLLRTHSLTGRPRYLSDALESAQLRQLMRSGSSGALAALGAVRQTNEYFQANHAADATFFTLFYAVYEPASRRLVFVNAGHNPALLFSPASGAVAWLKPTDIAVGFGLDRPYEPSECRMQPGDVLVLYTDGVTEAFDGRRRMFGEERLQAVVVAQAAEPAGSIVKAIAAAVSAHAGATPQSDDITLLVLRLENQDRVFSLSYRSTRLTGWCRSSLSLISFDDSGGASGGCQMGLKHRTLFFAVLGLLSLLLSLAGCTASPSASKVPVIGVMQFASNELLDPSREGIVKALNDAGYVDGSTARFIFKNAQGDLPSMQLIAQDLNRHADLIAVVSTQALQAALGAVKDKPIVFATVADPNTAGAGTSDSHPANVTGVPSTLPLRELLLAINEALPQARRLGVIYDPSLANSVFYINYLDEQRAGLDLEIVSMTVNGSAEVLQAANALAAKKVDTFFVLSDASVLQSFDSVVKVAEAQKIPLFSTTPNLVGKGASVALGWNYFDEGYLGGQLAARGY